MPKTRPTSNETGARTPTAKPDTRAQARVKAGRSSANTSKARSQQDRSTQPDSQKKPKRDRSTKSTSMSGLDAAAKVLESATEPMTCKEIVEAMVTKRLWSSNGKTPHATIYSAIIREIATRGKAARFKKADRGRFATSH